MKYEDPFGNPLPKGVFYDPERKRYRVRTYRHSKVVWCTYHRDHESALTAHGYATRARQNEMDKEGSVMTPDRFAAALQTNLAAES